MKKIVLRKILSNFRQMILLCGTFIGCFLTIIISLEPYSRPQSYNFSQQFEVEITTTNPSIFNLSSSKSDVFEIVGDVRINVSSSTVFIGTTSTRSQRANDALTNWTVKPCTRKQDALAMKRISSLKVNYATYNNDMSSTTMPMPKYCNKILATTPGASPTAATPAIVFSTEGYTGNTFHDFGDVILPLYYTSRRFNRSVLFLVTDPKPSWLSKYMLIFRELSRYDVVEVRNDDHDRVFCFNRVIVGLTTDEREFLMFDPTIMTDFTKMLRSAYSLERHTLLVPVARPRMLIISRKVVRRQLMNEQEVADMALGLGFEVVLSDMSEDVSEVARLVNSIDVMVGVHGAGLTNMVFLPENASVVQIIPFGVVDFARFCFKYPSKSMNLRYSEYITDLSETTLSAKYSGTEVNYTDPDRMMAEKGFSIFRKVYLDNQDLIIDVGKFRTTLLKALERFRL